MSITLQRVNSAADIAELARLAADIWREYYIAIITMEQIDYMIGQFQSVVAITDQIERQGYEYYAMQDDGAMVGYLSVRQEETGKLFLSKFYVGKACRGRGYASQAMAFLELLCQARNLSHIWLTVNRHNESSIAVYERKGFRIVREQAVDIGGGFVMDDYVMEKEITSSESNSMRERLDQAIRLREEGRAKQDQAMLAEVRALLLALAAAYPDVAEIHYQTGVAHDNSGMGRAAIPYYLRALELGLTGADLERCLLGLGSTYRSLGHYEEAVATLRRGTNEFPANRAIQVLLSMALYNTGQHKEAMELALTNLMDTTSDEKLLYFKRGLAYYAQHLDETW